MLPVIGLPGDLSGAGLTAAVTAFGTVIVSDHANGTARITDHTNGRVEIADNPIGTVNVRDSRIN
jgi:hypothetical protein